MKSGYKLIKELGRHGLRGYYFSYKQYNTLAKINNFPNVKEKIAEWGYPDALKTKDISELIIVLKKSTAMTDSEKGCFTVMFLEPLFWLMLLFFSGC